MGAILHSLFATAQTWTLPIKAQGDGSGVATMRVNVAGPVEVTTAGSAHFYTNSAGTTGESQWKLLATGWNTIYLRLASGVSALQFGCADRIVGWGNASNSGWDAGTTAPVPNMTTDDIPRRVTTIGLASNAGVIRFNSQYHTALTTLYLYNLSGLTGTFNSQYHAALTYLFLHSLPNLTGTFNSQYHTALTYLLLYSLSNLTGTFNSQYHTALTYLFLYGLSNLTGTFNSQYHAALTSLYLNNLPRLTGTGNIALLVSLTHLVLGSSTLSCTYNETSGSAIKLTQRLYVTLSSFTSAMVDAILIDTDNNTTGALITQPIYLVNGNAPTAASAAAIASLRTKGNTVTTS